MWPFRAWPKTLTQTKDTTYIVPGENFHSTTQIVLPWHQGTHRIRSHRAVAAQANPCWETLENPSATAVRVLPVVGQWRHWHLRSLFSSPPQQEQCVFSFVFEIDSFIEITPSNFTAEMYKTPGHNVIERCYPVILPATAMRSSHDHLNTHIVAPCWLV